MTASANPKRLLRRPEVEEMVGLKRAAIYSKIEQGTFPRPVRLGPHCVRWREEDIIRWMDELSSSDAP